MGSSRKLRELLSLKVFVLQVDCSGDSIDQIGSMKVVFSHWIAPACSLYCAKVILREIEKGN